MKAYPELNFSTWLGKFFTLSLFLFFLFHSLPHSFLYYFLVSFSLLSSRLLFLSIVRFSLFFLRVPVFSFLFLFPFPRQICLGFLFTNVFVSVLLSALGSSQRPRWRDDLGRLRDFFISFAKEKDFNPLDPKKWRSLPLNSLREKKVSLPFHINYLFVSYLLLWIMDSYLLLILFLSWQIGRMVHPKGVGIPTGPSDGLPRVSSASTRKGDNFLTNGRLLIYRAGQVCQ